MSEEEKDVAGGANHPTRHGSTDKFSVNYVGSVDLRGLRQTP